MIRKAALVLLLLAFLIVPVLGANISIIGPTDAEVQTVTLKSDNYVFDAADYDGGIMSVLFNKVNPQRIDFTVWQSDDTSHTGYIQYNRTFDINLKKTGSQILSLGAYSVNWTHGDNLLNNLYGIYYAKNWDAGQNGLLVSEVGYIYDGKYAFAPVSNILEHPITKIAFTSEEPVEIVVSYYDIGTVQEKITEAASAEPDKNLLDIVYDMLNTFISAIPLITMILGVFSFVFIKHYFEFVVIFESVIIAYSAATSKDFMSAAKKIVDYNKALVQAIAGCLIWIIDILHKVVTGIRSFLPF